MRILTTIPNSVYEMIIKDGHVNALTNWQDEAKFIAYRHLKEISGMNNFFFGMKITSDIEHLKELANMSSEDNDTLLELEIPDDECFVHDYYTFSDLIYYTDCEPDEITEKTCVSLLKSDPTSDCIQVIYPSIKSNYIIRMIDQN